MTVAHAIPSLLHRNVSPAHSAAGMRTVVGYMRSHVHARAVSGGTGKELLDRWCVAPMGSGLVERKRAWVAVPRALSEDGSLEFSKVSDEVAESPSAEYKHWDGMTARLAESATVAFLLLQLPQIILNTQNLMSGNNVALTAIPWMGQLTGLLGNLSLLSYFAGKRERGATVVQALGVLSTGVVITQLALGGAMPYPIYLGTAAVVVVGLLFNWLSYFNKLSLTLWQLWLDSVTVGGLTFLPQIMWSTFVPYISPSILPGTSFGTIALLLVILNRLNKLPPAALKFYTGLSAWTATLLFMWGPVAQAVYRIILGYFTTGLGNSPHHVYLPSCQRRFVLWSQCCACTLSRLNVCQRLESLFFEKPY
ncbi:hypothetical protein KC19_VG094300 [Ceratodon purpureus]|uniref:Maltose excess protein 1-like, chloroplastic n=1 Tax=Ceratodon purpureus TaxID=3225 RepID=A0A8T0HNQ0_CERPU|nr:hypothetical protein KC19_VG094300 [Ceratodon purpureus]